MGFARRTGIAFVCAVALFSISCDEHHVGEFPAVQRDRLAELKREQHSEKGGAPAVSPTPVKFFPENKSR